MLLAPLARESFTNTFRSSSSRSETKYDALSAGKVRLSACVTALAVFVSTSVASKPLDRDSLDFLALKDLDLEELMNVEVTSVSRKSERRFDAASAIQVIDSTDIHRHGATRIPEALRLAPNLHVAQIDTGLWAISARGFNNGLANKMLVLVDGRSIYTPMFAGVFWEVQDTLMEDIDRVEVVSGPGGTVWGANAVNGVISVTTKSARDTQGLLLEGVYGAELPILADVRYGGAVGSGLHYRIYAKYTDRDATRLPNGSQWTDDSQYTRGGFRMDWQASDQSLLTFQGDLYDGESGDLSTRNRIQAEGANLLARWQQVFSPDSDLKLQLYFDWTRRDAVSLASDNLETYDLDFQHRFGLGTRHDVIWGLGYRQIEDYFQSISGQTFLPPKLSHRLISAFAQDEIAIADGRVHLTAGLKIEHNDYTGFEFQPSIRIAAKPEDRQTVWAAISRAVRSPSRFDRDLHIPNRPPFSVVGGPDFESEILLAYELGYRVQPNDLVSFDLATFYNDYDKVRSVESINPPAVLPLEIRNNLAGHSYGAEFTTEFQASDAWRLSIGYRYLDVSLHAKPGSTDTTSVNAEAHDADHVVLFRSLLQVAKNIQLDTTFRYVDRIANFQLPAYEELDLRIAWQPAAQFELSLVGQNLLHAHHAEFRPLPTRHEIERNIFGKVAYTWR